MDVELQVLKHLARDPHSIAPVLDEYCAEYKDLFKEVRSYECFKYLHLGIISSIKRKTLPEIAKTVGIISAQSLHHFLSNSPWSVKELKERRLRKLLRTLNGQAITVVIDETGDRKKGKKTDYVSRQYLGSLGKIDNGIVSVNAYGVYKQISFPLIFKVFKPRATLKETEKYQTKIELATEIINELIEFGFKIELVLSDSLYGESHQFIKELGWTDYRLTSFKNIEKWWEIIFSVYTMVSLNSQPFLSRQPQKTSRVEKKDNAVNFSKHQQWDGGSGWKNTLNNLRLIVQPTLVLWLIFPWLEVFPNSKLLLGFNHLINLINQHQPFYTSGQLT